MFRNNTPKSTPFSKLELARKDKSERSNDAGLWVLQKFIDSKTFNNLSAIVAEIQKGNGPTTLSIAAGRRVISSGIAE